MTKHDPFAESARLAKYYAQLSEAELTQLGSEYNTLTEIAQTAIRTEFERRGLPAPKVAAVTRHEYQELVTIRRYRDLPEATVAKAALDSAGIYAFLSDENTVRTDWFWSNAIGGIQLRVTVEDKDAAERVLSESERPLTDAEKQDDFSMPVSVTIEPFLNVTNGTDAIGFYQVAFGAEVVFLIPPETGSTIAQMKIAGATFWLADESVEYQNPSPTTLKGSTVRLVLTVDDPDTVFERAVAAGAGVMWPMADQDYGWRMGRVVDPFGHHWEIGKPLRP